MNRPSQWLPIQQGFRFECQLCGECCRALTEVLLTGEEIVFFKHYDIPLHFRKMERKVEGQKKPQVAVMPTVALLEEDGQKRCFCLGNEDNPNVCNVHEFRPVSCFRFPFTIYTQRGRPFASEAVRAFLNREDISEEEAQKYVHKITYDIVGKKVDTYHLFAAQKIAQSGKPCAGFNKGTPWSTEDIRRYLSTNHMKFENHTIDIEACIARYSGDFGPEFDKHFEPVEGLPGYYRSRKRSWKDIVDEAGQNAKKGP